MIEGVGILSVNLWLRGGLGNQLFQYSFGLLVSQQMNLPLEIYSRLLPCKPDLLNGSGRWPQQISEFAHSGTLRTGKCQPSGGTDLVSQAHTALGYLLDLFPKSMARGGFAGGQKEKNWNSILSNASQRKAIYLNGYFIQKFAPEILRPTLVAQILQHSNGYPSEGQAVTARGYSNNHQMAVHIRLGDNLGQKKGLFQTYLDFFKHAVERADLDLGKQNLLLFSDQPEVARELLYRAVGSREIAVAKETSAIHALREMARCNGLIATPSTFAWWGGFLQRDQSHVYMGSPWVKGSEFDQSKIYPDAWNLVSKIG